MSLYVPLSRIAHPTTGAPMVEWVRYFNSLSPPLISLTTSGTFTPSFLSSNAFAITQSGPLTVANPINGTPNSILNIEVFQGPVGGNALAFGTAYVFPNGITPTWTTTANGRNFITGFYDGTNVLVTGTSAAASAGFANPMTTLGDLIEGAALGAPSRLGIGSAGQVLTVVGGVPAWASPPLITINNQAASYSLLAVDADPRTPTLVKMNVAGANTLTYPLNATIPIAVGSVGGWLQYGAGQTTHTPAVGVTLRTGSSLTSRAQYSSGTWAKIGTDEWLIDGDLT